MQHEVNGRVYDLRTMEEDPEYDNAPELNRMLKDTGRVGVRHPGVYQLRSTIHAGRFTPVDDEGE